MPREPKEPKEEGIENFQTPENFVPPVQQSPTEDPYAMMKQRDELVFNALQDINNRLTNLQETWDRILNVAKEPPMRQQYYRPLYQQPQQPVYPPPAYYPPDNPVAGLPPVDDRPKWDKEVKEEPKKATKLKPNKLMLIALVMVVLIIVAMTLKGQGWGCIIGG